MRPGCLRRNTQATSTIMAPPRTMPSTGDTTMKIAILTTPDVCTTARPPFEIPAPSSPPTSACEELDGMPYHQVMRFQAMAPPSAPTMTASSTIFGSMMPLPTVWATCSGKTTKAMKLKKAAHATARFGVSTRVDTIVAIEFAASWKPLM